MFEQNYPVLVDNVACIRYEFLNKNYSTRHGITSYEFLDRDVPNISKRTWTMSLSLVIHYYYIVILYLLKTLYSLASRHGEIHLKLNRKHPLIRVAFIVPRGILYRLSSGLGVRFQ